MVRTTTFKTAFLCFLPLIDSMEFKRSSAAAVPGSPPLHVSKLHLTDHLRTLLPVRNVLEHLQEEHGKGNRYPKFILEIRDGRGEAIAVEVVESQTAILPTATYSVHGRPSREVGHLGHLNLVSADELSGDFVLLTLNPVDGEVRGVVKRLEEDWVIVNGENEMFSSGIERNLDLFENADDDIVENVPREAVENLHVIEEGLHTLHPRRQLQAFHSNYLYQVDLFLDIDYEFVRNNGGTLCNVFSYVNSLVTAANAVLEREVMSHLNVVSIRQTTFYDDVDSTTDALGKMKKEFGGPEWHENGVDLHYALLGKMLSGGLGERAGIAFIENSLCDPTRGFGLVSGLKGGFSSLDERLGSDLKRFMYAIEHSFGSGPVSGELESLLFTYGGSWSHRSNMNNIDSWLDNPNLDSRENPRRVPYNMFMSANDRSDKCLDVSSRSYTKEDSIIGECLSGMSFKSSDGNDLSFESSEHYLSDAMVGGQGPPISSPAFSPSYIPTYLPTLVPTASPTRNKSSKQTKGADDSKGGKDGDENSGSGKTAKEISSDRDVSKNDDNEISVSKLLFASRSFGTRTEVVSVKNSISNGGIPLMMTSIVKAPKKKTEGGSGKTGKDPKEHKEPSESKSAKKRPHDMTTIYMYSTLEWNFNCSDVNNATLLNVATVVEKSIFEGIAPQITPLELVSVFVWSICNHTFLPNTLRTVHGTRLLEEVPLTKIEFIAQVTTQDHCDNCGQQLFTATSSALQSIVKSENLTSSIHINSNGTILAVINPNSTNSTFTLSTSSPTKSPSSSPRTTNPPTQKPRKTRTRKPTPLPTSPPSIKPTHTPSSASPTKLVNTTNTPTTRPTNAATKATKYPSTLPSKSPSKSTNNSTTSPSTKPSLSTSLSGSPSKSPISFRTNSPSKAPSNPPSTSPTRGPSISQSSLTSMSPTKSPSNAPSKPSALQSEGPSMSPMGEPTKAPSNSPSTSPTRGPSISPLSLPSISPTKSPSKAPSTPSASPSAGPSLSPMMRPSKAPSTSPSTSPTQGPSISPSLLPSSSLMENPTKAPSNPSASPSAGPSLSPMGKPSKASSTSPLTSPTQGPSISPPSLPSISLTETPSKASSKSSPSAGPSLSPTGRPGNAPSK
ncbi:hypothetical protein ACHAW6_006270, partial [Cyclotella cf. meneghiniana]